MDKERDREFLAELQSMPLEDKIQRTIGLIGSWHSYFDNKVYVSLSGGKDSTVLADLDAQWCRAINKPLNLCFSNTGLEYPEIQKHVRAMKEYFGDKYGIDVNLKIVVPKMRFGEVISKYGYPLIGKEVAEAIYYARRLRSAERERERRRRDLRGEWRHEPDTHTQRTDNCSTDSIPEKGRMYGKESNSRADASHSRQASGIPRKERTELLGIRTMPKRPQDAEQISKRTGSSWNGAGVERNGQIGEGGVFSNPKEQFGKKSMFSKEKWLPLARDLPVAVSHICCNKLKKAPLKTFQKETGMKPFLGTMAEESRLRRQAWIRHGRNAFDGSKQTSQPLSFWTKQDILTYTVNHDLPLASCYGEIVAVDAAGNEYDPHSLIGNCGTLKCTGCSRTGCIFCGFGAHLEKPGEGRFERLAFTHPRQYDYCINGGQWVDNPAYDPTAPKMDGDWQNWNPKKIWVPSKQGLGFGKVFEMLCEIYGDDFIRWR